MFEPQIITSRNITIFADVQIVEARREFVVEKTTMPCLEVRSVISKDLINVVTNQRSPSLKSNFVSVFDTVISLIFESRTEKVGR